MTASHSSDGDSANFLMSWAFSIGVKAVFLVEGLCTCEQGGRQGRYIGKVTKVGRR